MTTRCSKKSLLHRVTHIYYLEDIIRICRSFIQPERCFVY